MPKDYDNTNKGVLFVNTYREEGDNKPAYKGSLNVEGEEIQLAAWENVSKGGNAYLSLRVSEPRDDTDKSDSDSDEVPF